MTTFQYTLAMPVATVPTPSGWAYGGCMTDAGSTRALNSYSFTSNAMTIEMCATGCLNRGYTLAGVEYANQCYCGNSYTSGTAVGKQSTCNMACGGESLRSGA